MKRKKIYFASDVHLGLEKFGASLKREKHFVAWLESIRHKAQEIYLLGDIFDFWFEYKQVVPRGHTRLLGKLAEIADSGVPIHFFTGNHDLWVFDYLAEELGVIVHTKPYETELYGKKFFLAHGDGLGPGDAGYKRLKKIFTNKLAQWAFRWLHPDLGMAFGHAWSRKRRYHEKQSVFLGEDQEWLVLFSRQKLQMHSFDYFIFGHRHIPIQLKIADSAVYVNLGDWLSHFTYGEFDGEKFSLQTYNFDL